VKTPRDLFTWGISALLTALAIALIYVVVVVATDEKNDFQMLFVYASWTVGGIGVLLLIGAAVSKVIQVGVRSARDD